MTKKKRIYKLILSISAILFLILSFLTVGVIENYAKLFEVRFGNNSSFGKRFTLEQLRRGYEDIGIYIVNSLTAPDLETTSSLDTYSVYIDPYAYGQLVSNLPLSGGKEVKGYMTYNNNKTQDVKLRFRGDNQWHWLYEKKSWRIKTDKTELINGTRKLNLVNSREMCMMVDYVGAKIGIGMGLLTADVEHARVFINNDYSGVHLVVDQTDEYFLRKNNKLPSDIYTGDVDFLEEGKKYNAPNIWAVSDIAESWSKLAEYNVLAPDDLSHMDTLVNMVKNTPKENFAYEVSTILDMDKYTKWYALMRIIRSQHADNYHNNKFYLDPSSGKLEPIVWDMYALTSQVNVNFPILYEFNDLTGKVLQQPEYTEKINKYIYEAINNTATVNNVNKLIEYEYNRIKKDVYADINKDYVMFFEDQTTESRPYTNTQFDESITELKDWYEARVLFLSDELERANLYYEQPKIIDKNIYSLKLAASGQSGIFIRQLGFDTIDFIEIYEDRNFNYKLDKNDRKIYSGNGKEVEFNQQLYPGKLLGDEGNLQDALMNYNYIIVSDRDLTLSKIIANNSVTNRTLFAVQADIEDVHDNLFTVHPWREYRDETVENIIFAEGDHIITEDLIINKNSSLTIDAGAVLRMKAGVSIFAYGQVNINGTEEKNVRITPYDKEKPWGVFAIQGYYNPTFENSINYATIEFGGLESYHENTLYTGMLSAYNTNLTMKNTNIIGNTGGDDAFNAKQSYVIIKDCLFKDAFSDAIDFDFTDGVIDNCYFLNSGNDAIDIMTSSPTISNNYMTNSGDKGISIGEKSNPLVLNNHINECVIGIQIKDLSDPKIINNLLVGNGLGISLYHKNDKYESGGRGSLINTIILDSEQFDIQIANDDSYLTCINSYVNTIDSSDKKISLNECYGGDYELKNMLDKNFILKPDFGRFDLKETTSYLEDYFDISGDIPIGLIEQITRWWEDE